MVRIDHPIGDGLSLDEAERLVRDILAAVEEARR